MEYNQSFAMGEAIVLVGVVAWLFYINSSSSRSSSSESTDQPDQKSEQDGTDRT